MTWVKHLLNVGLHEMMIKDPGVLRSPEWVNWGASLPLYPGTALDGCHYDICPYVCMYVKSLRMYSSRCMYVICIFVCMYIFMECMNVCTYVCNVCMQAYGNMKRGVLQQELITRSGQAKQRHYNLYSILNVMVCFFFHRDFLFVLNDIRRKTFWLNLPYIHYIQAYLHRYIHTHSFKVMYSDRAFKSSHASFKPIII